MWRGALMSTWSGPHEVEWYRCRGSMAFRGVLLFPGMAAVLLGTEITTAALGGERLLVSGSLSVVCSRVGWETILCCTRVASKGDVAWWRWVWVGAGLAHVSHG